MNFPTADIETLEPASLNPLSERGHPRLVCKIDLKGKDISKVFAVVESLSKEKVKNIIGDSDVVLTLVPTTAVKFGFQKLSLSLFTRT
jgi:hypothetical protein